MKKTKNMTVETYREIKQLIQESHNTRAHKAAMLQEIHDCYHYGQSIMIKMALKHPKMFLQNLN